MTGGSERLERVKGLLHLLISKCGLDVSFVCSAVGESDSVLSVEFAGPDAPMLTARNGELLHAIESLAAAVLQLEPEQHEQISFDALRFKANRRDLLRREAGRAAETVAATGRPYSFPPMNSRERRMLHLELAAVGLRTASSGEGGRRFVVVYPPESAATPATGQREKVIRSAFRPR